MKYIRSVAMRVYFCFVIISAFGAMSTAKGINQRRMQPNEAIVDFISNTEIFNVNASKAVMVSREDPTADVNSRTVPCSSPSAQWLKQQFSNVTNEDVNNFFDWHVYTLPFAYKLFVQENAQNNNQEYFGLDGEYTHEINYIHEQAQDFWTNLGINDEIQVLCAHGSDLADRHTKLIPTLEVLFSESYDDEYTVFEHASDIQGLITRLPGGYNFPLLTFNAFATDEKNENGYPSIIIGDGYFEFQQSVGMESEGPEYALTHEHAHHLQFALGVPQKYSSNQDARREELMADAFSAYYLAHNSGGDMTSEEISNIHEIAYSLGDCEMSSVHHHGTPQQRRCATRWGASIVEYRNGVNFNLIELKDRFDMWYESVDDSDSLVCEYAATATSSAYFTSRNAVLAQLIVLAFLYGNETMFGL